MASRPWRLDGDLRLLVPCDCDSQRVSCAAYFSSAEALRWQPWQTADGQLLPQDAESTAASEAVQQSEHQSAIGGAEVDGYASWIANDGAPPIKLRETTAHTGTRIWEAAWLHRQWALDRAHLFRNVEVLECGAGCGLLGLSIAAANPTARVTLSDFAGHFVGAAESVLTNLVCNAKQNASQADDRVRVVELDWTHPEAPQLWWPQHEEVPRPCGVDVVGIVLATECIYSEEGARLLAAVIARWMRRPSGIASLLNNAHRPGVEQFEQACTELGMRAERQPAPPRPACVVSTFAPWTDDDYVMWEVVWS